MYKLKDLNPQWVQKPYLPFSFHRKSRVNILAMGDVGGMLAVGLKLLGGDVIENIGICDINHKVSMRYETELDQIAFPFEEVCMPEAAAVEAEQLFDCDVFVFCASKAVPSVGEKVLDVRMAQFEGNRGLIEQYACKAAEAGFKGLFAVVSDPVDPLCKAAYIGGEGKLLAEQIQGFGLGVMNSRAMYFAKRHRIYESYLLEGRAFGPHGEDLVIANSMNNYDDKLSRELTELTVKANLKVRELGFKPYIAPALSSGAISLILTLRGKWHYSSNFIGTEKEGAFMGALNIMTEHGTEFEERAIDDILFERIRRAYENLKRI